VRITSVVVAVVSGGPVTVTTPPPPHPPIQLVIVRVDVVRSVTTLVVPFCWELEMSKLHKVWTRCPPNEKKLTSTVVLVTGQVVTVVKVVRVVVVSADVNHLGTRS
jgi:hypothetical protein